MATVELSEEEVEHLEYFAKKENISFQDLARRAIDEYIADLEDAELAQNAHDKWVAGGKKIAGNFADLKKELGLDD